MSKRVLIIGGYGVFGGRLAKALASQDNFEVIVAGRELEKAAAFCEGNSCLPIAVDTQAAGLVHAFSTHDLDIVIDAAGPFQNYANDTYAVAKAAIRCGAHYLDLSDDAAFTAGIVALDELARAADVTVMSGVSSVPALSSVVIGELAQDMTDIHLIESAILPGNRAPRGLSVVKAIVGQAGCNMTIWRGGRHEIAKGWSDLKVVVLGAPGANGRKRRWASLIGAPDLALFPDYFKARSVVFRAGLDLKLMHGGLWLLSLPVRWGWLASILPLAPLLKWAADRLEPFGSDMGGMVVSVEGETQNNIYEKHTWTLIAQGGDGPNIPTIPAQIICTKLLTGEFEAGAMPCLEAFALSEAETVLRQLQVKTDRQSLPCDLLFKKVLGPKFAELPEQLAELHAVIDVRRWQGRASIRRGRGLFSKIAGWVAGFPPAAEDVDVTVEMRRGDDQEIWTRTFGAHRFRSYLKAKRAESKSFLYERFGLLSFQIGLHVDEGKLCYPILGGRALGLPLPQFLLPKSITHEYVDDHGRACFDVRISLPIAGHVVSYSGWLLPDS